MPVNSGLGVHGETAAAPVNDQCRRIAPRRGERSGGPDAGALLGASWHTAHSITVSWTVTVWRLAEDSA